MLISSTAREEEKGYLFFSIPIRRASYNSMMATTTNSKALFFKLHWQMFHDIFLILFINLFPFSLLKPSFTQKNQSIGGMKNDD